MEAIIGLLGVIIGFVLNEIAQGVRLSRTEKQQRNSVRTLLCLEIDRNLELLENFWNQVYQIQDNHAELPVEEQDQKLASRFTDLPLPHWNYEAQESQMSLLPVTLSEQEIVELYNLRNRLDTVTTTYEKLSVVQSEIRDLFGFFAGNHFEVQDRHIRQVATQRRALLLWHEAEAVVRRTLDTGNPLRSKV